MRQYLWLARSKPILLLLTAWCLSYAGDLAAFTAASVYAFRAGGAGLVAVLGLLKALPGAFLVPVVTSGTRKAPGSALSSPSTATSPAPPALNAYTDAAVNAARSPA